MRRIRSKFEVGWKSFVEGTGDREIKQMGGGGDNDES